MSAAQIKTVRDLLDYLYTLSEKAADISLDTYLRTLWGLIQREQNTPDLVGKLFAEAFVKEPLPFDEDWLQYKAPSLDNKPMNDYEYLRHTILYQIADLYRIRDLEISPLDRYAGFESPTGHIWYNTELAGYLECGVSGFYSHSEGFNNKDLSHSSDPLSSLLSELKPVGREFNSTEFSWRDVAEILYLGQIYE